jgi:hypothetical protein
VLQDTEGHDGVSRLDTNVVGGRVDDLSLRQQPACLVCDRAQGLDTDVGNLGMAPQELDEIRTAAAAEVDDPERALRSRNRALDQLQAVELGGISCG